MFFIIFLTLLITIEPSVAIDPTPASSYQFLGCFADSIGNDLIALQTQFAILQPGVCATTCRDYLYFAVRNNTCMCDNTFGRYGQLDTSLCNYNCPYAQANQCGGHLVNSVFYNKNIKFNYMGCYGDNLISRDLNGTSKILTSLDLFECVEYCRQNQFAYAGVQQGSICFCGNSYSSYGRVSDSKCGISCPKAQGYFCGGSSTVNSVYLVDACLIQPKKCGYDATCRDVNGVAKCSCPNNATYDVQKKQCQENVWCQAQGDPHFKNFDNYYFDFYGYCKYRLVSTTCITNNGELPAGLVPFNINMKAESRETTSGTSYVNQAELIVFGNTYTILKSGRFLVNKQIYTAPYSDSFGISFIRAPANTLTLNTNFGLQIQFIDDHNLNVYLSKKYQLQVCGLCGNIDGKDYNDLVDPLGHLYNVGSGLMLNFDWASTWRIKDDFSYAVDRNGVQCSSALSTQGVPVKQPELKYPCQNETVYQSNDWCGPIKNPTGPWSTCVSKMSSNQLEFLYQACVLDLCLLETTDDLDKGKCTTLQQFATACNRLASSMNQTWPSDWRAKLDCMVQCGENQVAQTSPKCPFTCSNPTGDYDCGSLISSQDCNCQSGYVFNYQGKCVEQKECGCKTTSGVLLAVNTTLISTDCSVKYVCNGVEQKATEISLTPCSNNAQCLTSTNSATPKCVCNSGFYGDGYTCQKLKLYNENCLQSSECSSSLICLNQKCLCTGTSLFWSSTSQTCVSKVGLNQACSDTNPCDDNLGLTCQNNICQCSSSSYFDGQKCTSLLSYGVKCLNNQQCDSRLNLICSNGVCNCSDQSLYWSSSKCVQKAGKDQTCSSTTQCNDLIGLSCQSGTCQCSGTTSFYDGTKCTVRLLTTARCTSSSQCDSSVGLSCINNICQCANQSFYWNSASLSCASKLGYTESCTLSQKCNDVLGLTCNNGACGCSDSTFYFDGSKCAQKIAYGVACNANQQCDDSQGLVCSSGKCQCSNTSLYYSTTDHSCVDKLNFGKKCSSNTECNDLIGLSCLNTSCVCSSLDKYYDGKSCSDLMSFNSSCTAEGQCNSAKGLSCWLGSCVCIKSSQYWNVKSQSCVDKLSYGKACSQETKCDDQSGLRCLNQTCICDSGYIYNGSYCVSRVTNLSTTLLTFQAKNFSRISSIDFSGNNLVPSFTSSSIDDCESRCAQNELCFTYTYTKGTCWLKFRYRYDYTSVDSSSSISGYPIIVNYCIVAIGKNDTFEYVSNDVKYLSNSSPEECCMSCYYTNTCVAWYMHRLNKMCTMVMKGTYVAQTSSNFIAGEKPAFKQI